MARFRQEIDPKRLCDAAEAALKAVAEVAEATGGKWYYPADLMGFPSQPVCLAEYTRDEIEQASEFLVRLGWIEPRPRPSKAA